MSVQDVQGGGGLLHWQKLLQQGEAGRCSGLIWDFQPEAINVPSWAQPQNTKLVHISNHI